MFERYTYRGRHRAPTSTGRTAARVAVTGTVAALPAAAVAPAVHAAPDSVWDRLAECESSGNWTINTGNGYSGGLQFHPQTWRGFGGGEFAAFAHLASRAEQIVVAERVLDAQGWGAWPACSSKLGLRGIGVDLRDGPAAAEPAPRQAAPERARSDSEAEDDRPAPTARKAAPAPRKVAPAPREAAPQPAAPRPAAPQNARPTLGAGDPGGYVVANGDTLSEIAAANGTTWQQLYERNREIVEHPDWIYVGERLSL